MKQSRQATGRQGEAEAVAELERLGYCLVEQGWRCARGEIDIVATDGDCWAFVEVKTRHGHYAGLPEEALNKRKWERLSELSQLYLTEHELFDVSWRIDLVAIELDSGHRVKRLNVVKGTTPP